MLHFGAIPLQKNMYAMVYLENFRFPSREKEYDYVTSMPNTYWNKSHDIWYPFFVLSENQLYSLDFEPITILYGGNGSGKSTIINVISNALKIKRDSLYNSSTHMEEYCELCSFKTDISWSGEEFNYVGERQSKYDISEFSRVITSDDIFKIMLDDRMKKEQKLYKSKILSREIGAVKSMDIQTEGSKYDRLRKLNFETGENIEEYRHFWEMRKAKSFAKYLKEKLGPIERGYSNGENSMMYLAEEIQQEGLYLLDEPENSLSPKFQKGLAEIISFSEKRCCSQFIIATHSPFLLAIPNAKIYNLDENPVTVSKMWELENMREYYDLFKSYSDKFESD